MDSDLKFANYSLELARNEGYSFTWFEERRFSWCKITQNFIQNILDGYSIILLTDEKRKWFSKYILQNINLNAKRPLIPIFEFDATSCDKELFYDMLNISFKHYTIWYIGNTNHYFCTLASSHMHNYIWSFDKNMPQSFELDSNEKHCDIKLLQLFILLNKTLDTMMFGNL